MGPASPASFDGWDHCIEEIVLTMPTETKRPAEPFHFEHLRDAPREERAAAMAALSEDDIRNLLMDAAVRGLSDFRWLIPMDFAGQYDEGKRWWMFHTNGGLYRLQVTKVPKDSNWEI